MATRIPNSFKLIVCLILCGITVDSCEAITENTYSVPYTIACKYSTELAESWVDDFTVDVGDSCRVLSSYTPTIVVYMPEYGPVRVRFNTSPVEYYIRRGMIEYE